MKITNPTFETLFISSYKYVAMLDAQKSYTTLENLKHENDTFYERTIKTFINSALIYYSYNDIQAWINNYLLDLKQLPRLF